MMLTVGGSVMMCGETVITMMMMVMSTAGGRVPGGQDHQPNLHH